MNFKNSETVKQLLNSLFDFDLQKKRLDLPFAHLAKAEKDEEKYSSQIDV